MHSLTLQYHFSVSLRGSLLCQHQVLCKCHRVIYIYLDIIYIYLPALQIQSTYPVSSRSSRCDSLSAMKPARDSTLSFSFANSLNMWMLLYQNRLVRNTASMSIRTTRMTTHAKQSYAEPKGP